ncbi:sugar isomerase [Labrys miyagiensis]|uniref:Glutamine--fructose-6-phosphate aminotransferase [isomerizing] n=1 Tax=Labrys miyagiensis TaxID=346912 RepID=A0ABQ6CRU2_9HYPH|nr:sugar isomerase [Labrys miyagiensis]GLS23071.1 sugar isomerase [Labrys miyagiensis]
MSKDMIVERIGFRDAVARQPESLEITRKAVAETLKSLDIGGFAGMTVGFAGIGASYQAALAGAAFLRANGVRSFAYCSTDLYESSDAGADAFVALSASGQSVEIADVMTVRASRPRIAICRGSDNPLAEITGRVIATHSGNDNGASSTGYTSMLLAIGLLGDRILGRDTADWAGLPGMITDMLASVAGPAKSAAELLANRAAIDLVGAGAAFATAGEAAILIREAVRVPAVGWDTLNYLHGPMEAMDGRTGLIAFGEGREVQIAQDIAGFGCPSVLITSRADVAPADRLLAIKVPGLGNEIADAILQIIASQVIVAEMQDAAGLTDTRFRYPQSGTKLKAWSAATL